MKNLTKLGLILTTIWLLLVVGIICWKANDFISLDLNEIGDFLAGLCAPLALLWLVIGYFQQGEELRLNTKALILQQKELEKQVQETALLAKNAERQAAASELQAQLTKQDIEHLREKEIYDAQPVFRNIGGTSSNGGNICRIKNLGGTATDLSIIADANVYMQILPTEIFHKDGDGKIIYQGVTGFPFNFEIQYKDRFESIKIKKYTMVKDYTFKEIL